MGVLPEDDLGRQNLLEADGCLVAGRRVGGAGRVLHAHRVEVNAAIEQLPDDVDVELGRVDRLVLERQPHQRHTDLVVHAGVDDRLAGLGQVVDIVHVVEVAIPGRAVLRHQLGLHLEGVEPLGGQGHTGDRAGEDLEIDVRTHRLAHLVLAHEGVLADIEEGRLVTGSAAELEVPDAGLFGREFHGRQDVGEPDLAAERALQAVAERREHDSDPLRFLGENHVSSSIWVTFAPG